LNVINKETTKVGFAVRENIVMGYYCPKANTDPEALKINTPRERVAPTPPEAPEGVQLVSNSPCPELDDTGRRGVCQEGLCCGMSTSTSDPTNTIDHCLADSTKAYEGDGDSWTFECYQDARRLALSLGAIIVSIGLSYF